MSTIEDNDSDEEEEEESSPWDWLEKTKLLLEGLLALLRIVAELLRM